MPCIILVPHDADQRLPLLTLADGVLLPINKEASQAPAVSLVLEERSLSFSSGAPSEEGDHGQNERAQVQPPPDIRIERFLGACHQLTIFDLPMPLAQLPTQTAAGLS